MELLIKADSNRYKCTECNGKINQGDKFFRRTQKGWRTSHTVNLCRKCLIKMMVLLKVTEEETNECLKEMVMEANG